MKKYRVLLAFNAYQEYEVEAENQSEALDRAEKLAPPASGFCEAERHPDGDIVEEVQSEFSPERKTYICKSCESEFKTKYTQTKCAFCMGQLEEKENVEN